MMKRHARTLVAFPILAAFLVSVPPAFGGSDIGVNLNINLGPPPVLVSPPPELVPIPGTGIYFIPGISADIFFFDGYWWAPRGPRWYRAQAPNGPWVIVGSRTVPRPLVRVPTDYRVVYAHERRIPYGQWKKGHGNRGRGRHHGHGKD